MIGKIETMQGKGRCVPRRERIEQLSLLAVPLWQTEGSSVRRVERRLRKLEEILCRCGVSRVIVPAGFPYKTELKRLRPVEVLPFYHEIADIFVFGWLNAHGIPPRKGRVALAAPRLCSPLQETAERLYPHVRHLIIQVPKEGEGYARRLCRRFGVPVMPDCMPADVTVAFGPVQGRAGARILLYGVQPDLQGLCVRSPGLPLQECYADSLLALMWEQGYLSRDRLIATISGQTLANERVVCYNY